MSLENKILLPLLPGLEPATFLSQVWLSATGTELSLSCPCVENLELCKDPSFAPGAVQNITFDALSAAGNMVFLISRFLFCFVSLMVNQTVACCLMNLVFPLWYDLLGWLCIPISPLWSRRHYVTSGSACALIFVIMLFSNCGSRDQSDHSSPAQFIARQSG